MRLPFAASCFSCRHRQGVLSSFLFLVPGGLMAEGGKSARGQQKKKKKMAHTVTATAHSTNAFPTTDEAPAASASKSPTPWAILAFWHTIYYIVSLCAC